MNPYLILGISVVILIVFIFSLTFFLNKKTPVPKGCENLRVGEEGCACCKNYSCSIRRKLIKEDEDNKDLKEEE